MQRKCLAYVVLFFMLPVTGRSQIIGLDATTKHIGTVTPGAAYSASFTVYAITDPREVSVTIANTISTITSITPEVFYAQPASPVTVWFAGVAPSNTGDFSELIKFNFWHPTTGDFFSSATLMGTVGTSGGPSGGGTTSSWVGVIPLAMTCPIGTTLVKFFMDDEDNNNQNNRGGWLGGITSDRNTTLRFCRVRGDQFKSLNSPILSSNNHYAVLNLGGPCPNGSTSFDRKFDNENTNNKTSLCVSRTDPTICVSNPSEQGPNWADFDTKLHFCLFKGFGSTMSIFPDLGFQYGVLAPVGFTKAVETGWIFTDDEDAWGTNGNRFGGDTEGRRIVAPTGDSGRNTTLYLARVTPETRPVARCVVSPTSATESVYAQFADNGSYARNGRQISGYAWSFSNGTYSNGPGPHYRSFSVPTGSAGSLTGTLTVTDNYGESSRASCSVFVSSEGTCTSPRPGISRQIENPCNE